MVMFSTTSSSFSFLYRVEHLGFSKLKTKKWKTEINVGGEGDILTVCLEEMLKIRRK